MEEDKSISRLLETTRPTNETEANEFLYARPEFKEGDPVIAYLRKSVEKEDIEPMRRAMDEFISAHKLNLIPRNDAEKYFIETKSGTLDDSRRPIFREAIEFCKDRNIKAVIAPDASRYSREGPRYMLRYIERFNTYGTLAFTLSAGWLLLDGYHGTLTDEMTTIFLAWAAAFEAKEIGYRTKRALAGQRRDLARQGFFIDKFGNKKERSAGRPDKEWPVEAIREIEKCVRLRYKAPMICTIINDKFNVLNKKNEKQLLTPHDVYKFQELYKKDPTRAFEEQVKVGKEAKAEEVL